MDPTALPNHRLIHHRVLNGFAGAADLTLSQNQVLVGYGGFMFVPRTNIAREGGEQL